MPWLEEPVLPTWRSLHVESGCTAKVHRLGPGIPEGPGGCWMLEICQVESVFPKIPLKIHCASGECKDEEEMLLTSARNSQWEEGVMNTRASRGHALLQGIS